MAHIYPRRPNPATRSHAELALYAALQQKLPDDYTIFHSVRWLVRDLRAGARDGEADFVVVHPDYGILVIEVKGGRIRYHGANDEWTSNGMAIKDPFAQAEGNKHSLRRKLKEVPYWRDRWIDLGHAVAFPDGLVRGDMRLDAPREIILDAHDMEDVAAWVQRAFAYYAGGGAADGGPGPEGVRQLIDLLCPAREIRRPLGLAMSLESREILGLTEEQFYLLDVLGTQRRVAISGCAGSGKTTLALEQARRLGKQGFRVLLACYNTHIVGFLAQQSLPASVTVAGFHQLCRDTAERAGLPCEQAPAESLADYFLRFPELLLEAASILGPQYDALIVDEGQDFESDWWLPLQALLVDPDQSLMYVFYDDNQNLYQTADGMPRELGLSEYHLTRNLRNTRSIHATFMPFYHSRQVPEAIGPHGRPPEVAYYANEAELRALLSRTLHRLMAVEQVPAQDIVILTPRSAEHSALAQWPTLGNAHLAAARAASPGEISFHSIYKFKGLESAVVILVECRSTENQNLEALLYVGCSRACHHLIILADQSLPEAARAHLPPPKPSTATGA